MFYKYIQKTKKCGIILKKSIKIYDNIVNIRDNDAVINMDIDYGASFLNMLGNAITYGIWAPSKAHVTGTIVKYKDNVAM